MTGYRKMVGGDPKNRAEGEFYITPPIAIQNFLEVEQIAGPCWDPACGDGAFARVLRTHGISVRSSDLYDRGFGSVGVDFLETKRMPEGTQTIITNPPYNIGFDFAEKALSLKPRKVCLLLRLMWLESGRRREFFQTSGLTRVWVHSTRINVRRYDFVRGREDGRGGMVPFAWFVWVRNHKGPATLGWLP